MRGKRLTVAVFAALVCAALFGPALAAAGVKSIWPGDLIPEQANQEYRQRQTAVLVLPGGSGDFYAPIKLPAGAVVTKVEIYYNGTDANADMFVRLFRQKLGEGLPSLLNDIMVEFNPTGSTSSLIESTNSTSIQYSRVQRDSRYFLYVVIRDDASVFYGAKIFYRK